MRVTSGKQSGSLIVFRICKPRRSASWRYDVPHVLGTTAFSAKLAEAERFLRRSARFQWLPDLPAGEDLDLLVDDDSLDLVKSLLEEGPGLQPCDLYSASGLPGSDYCNLPYFPPHLANELLRSDESYKGVCQIPAPRHYFLSLAYHAVYHKGPKSGIASQNPHGRPVKRPEHDYVAELRTTAESIGLQVPQTLEELDTLLQVQGWCPPRDMLVRLARRQKALKALLANRRLEPEERGLSVFLIREEVVRQNRLDEMIGLIQHEGFQVLATKVLTDQESHAASRTVRGGNWGRGPWPADGGRPIAAVVAYDAEPIPVLRRQRRRYPEVTNARLLRKGEIRDAFNKAVPPDKHCNALHSSDNGHEALEYIQILLPEVLPHIRQQIVARKQVAAARIPIIFKLSTFRRRATAELIEHHWAIGGKKDLSAAPAPLLPARSAGLAN